MHARLFGVYGSMRVESSKESEARERGDSSFPKACLEFTVHLPLFNDTTTLPLTPAPPAGNAGSVVLGTSTGKFQIPKPNPSKFKTQGPHPERDDQEDCPREPVVPSGLFLNLRTTA